MIFILNKKDRNEEDVPNAQQVYAPQSILSMF